LHAPAEITACPAELRYALFAPVFPSISKPGHAPDRDPAALRTALARPGHPPVLALGGVTPAHLSAAPEEGFADAAVLGWFWRDDDLVAHLARWRELEDAWPAGPPPR
jgi:thiamine-phosphate pyrophosphorylase